MIPQYYPDEPETNPVRTAAAANTTDDESVHVYESAEYRMIKLLESINYNLLELNSRVRMIENYIGLINDKMEILK